MKRIIFFLLCLLGGAFLVVLFFIMKFSSAPYQGPASDHFDGKIFLNRYGKPKLHSEKSFLRWRLERLRNASTNSWRPYQENPPGPPPPQNITGGDLRVTFINHSTVLVQMHGLNILTDPIWSMRCSPFAWIGPHRHRNPGIRFEDLPPIDAVLISHNHYDHLDLPTLKRLSQAHHAKIYTGLGNKKFLHASGLENVSELDWWQNIPLSSEITLVAVPAEHFSARSVNDRNRTLWVGFVLHSQKGSVYFAGDTGWGDHFRLIAERLGPIRLALLPIGAYLPRWFMAPVHISPEEAVQAHQTLQAQISMAIHFGTFQLGDDGQEEPVADLQKSLTKEKHQNPLKPFWVLDFGEGRQVPPLP